MTAAAWEQRKAERKAADTARKAAHAKDRKTR